MADQNVKIKIGSSYDGAGTARAMSSLNNLASTAGRASSAVGSLAGVFDGLSGAAGKSVGAVSRLFGAFATGGVLGAAIAGVTAFVGIFQSYKEKQEEATKAALEHAKKVKQLQDEAAKKAWHDFVADLASGRIEAEKLAARLEKVVSLTKAVRDAQSATAASEGNIEVAKLNAQTASNVIGADTPEAKELAQAEGDLKAVVLSNKLGMESVQRNLDTLAETLKETETGYNEFLTAYDELDRQANELVATWKEQNKDKIASAAMEDKLNAKRIQDYKTDEQIAEDLMQNDKTFQKKMKAIQEEMEKTNDAIQTSGAKIAVLK